MRAIKGNNLAPGISAEFSRRKE